MSKLVRQWILAITATLLSSTENTGELNRYLKHVCFKDESWGIF